MANNINHIFKSKYDINNHSFNEFIEESGLPVPIQQNPWELSILVEEYKKLKPTVTVEIGSYAGGTLWFWLKNAIENATIVSIDIFWHHQKNFGFDNDEEPLIFFNNLWSKWAKLSTNFKVFQLDSNNITTKNTLLKYLSNYTSLYGQRCIDFLFIDGNHDYNFVKKDFILYGNLVKPGGIIVLHDIHESNLEVKLLWNEIVEAGYKTKQIYSPTGLEMGIGVVYIEE